MDNPQLHEALFGISSLSDAALRGACNRWGRCACSHRTCTCAHTHLHNHTQHLTTRCTHTHTHTHSALGDADWGLLVLQHLKAMEQRPTNAPAAFKLYTDSGACGARRS
jgi:hypothetical protein